MIKVKMLPVFNIIPPMVLNFSWITPKYFLQGWDLFFKEEIGSIACLHLIGIFLSYAFNCFSCCSQWQMSVFIILFRRIMAGGICTSDKRLDGQVVLITGSNTGLGKETARNLAKRGAKIVMACRNMTKANDVADELRKDTGAEIVTLKLDLSSLESVRAFVKEFKSQFDKLDILINNAGIMMCPFELTKDGNEIQYGVNHLGHFLLTNLLLPLLRSAPEARIISLSSLMHHSANMDLTDMTYKKGYLRTTSYGNSKLANVLFARILAQRLKDTNIKVFSLHPGVVQTELGRSLPFGMGYVYHNILGLVCKNPIGGIQTTIHCATEAEPVTHTYFSDCVETSPSDDAQDVVLGKKLWDISAKLVNLENN